MNTGHAHAPSVSDTLYIGTEMYPEKRGFTQLKSNETETFLSPLEVARTLNYTRPYVYSLIALGTLPAKREDGKWFVAKADVEKRREVRRGRKGVSNDRSN